MFKLFLKNKTSVLEYNIYIQKVHLFLTLTSVLSYTKICFRYREQNENLSVNTNLKTKATFS